jgi:hypothetical protein
MCAVVAHLWGACRAPGDEPDLVVLDTFPAPQIESIKFTCDLQGGTWRIEVGTDAWAGSGAIAWTVDGRYIEQHPVLRSVRAAEDGTSDLLRGDLVIMDDFRPAGVAGNTVFTCNDVPSFLLWVVGLDGEPSDCRRFGPVINPLLALDESPACPAVWTPPEPDEG